jgi:hypothetical protein
MNGHSDHITVPDIGILAYRSFSPGTEHFAAVPVFETELQLGVDPYFYFEALSSCQIFPRLSRRGASPASSRELVPLLKSSRD